MFTRCEALLIGITLVCSEDGIDLLFRLIILGVLLFALLPDCREDGSELFRSTRFGELSLAFLDLPLLPLK
ncbi:hypothetical protein TNCV_3764131 [Trichonephila clavipes]|uniref:Uncharacterized protein n=1 Tax=Trichonephila clavipes TaxID=2585209 RepID=A0A8X6VVE0_TRICX|nr:hypothetical protein TNCV_3764131 [Trichonephila clavipes]